MRIKGLVIRPTKVPSSTKAKTSFEPSSQLANDTFVIIILFVRLLNNGQNAAAQTEMKDEETVQVRK